MQSLKPWKPVLARHEPKNPEYQPKAADLNLPPTLRDFVPWIPEALVLALRRKPGPIRIQRMPLASWLVPETGSRHLADR